MLWSWFAVANADDMLQSASQVAMGRTGIASADDNAALTLNPGLLGLTDRYDFEGFFEVGPSGGLGWSGSAMDGRTSDVFAGGLFYSGDSFEPALTEDDLPGWSIPGEAIPNRRRFHDFGVAVAGRLADGRVSIGLGAIVGYYDHDRVGDGWRADGDLGIGLRPVDVLTVGLMARGFVPWGQQDVPFSTGAGVRVSPELFAAEADVQWFPSVEEGLPVSLSAGLEQGVGPVRLRGGWRYDAPAAVNAVSAGLGLEGDSAAIEYAAWVPVTGGLDIDTTVHTFSVRFGASPEIEEPK